MAVTHTTVGFKGTVDQIGEARRLARIGPRGTVADAAAWKVTQAAGDRVVTVAAGSGQSCGVTDTTSAVDTMSSLPAHSAAANVYRYDLIVARWKWTDPVTPVEFLALTGVSGANGPDLTKLVRNPGTQYDLVLAVVRVAGGQGTLTANDIFDCRIWGGISGAMQAAVTVDLTVVDGRAGEHLEVAGLTDYRHNGSAWQVWTDLVWKTYTPTWSATGATVQPSIGNGTLTGRYRRLEGVTGMVRTLLTLGSTTGGGDGTTYSFGLPPGWVAGPGAPAVAPGWFKSAADEGPLTGFITAGADRIFPVRADQNNAAVGNGLLTGANQFIALGATLELA